jgi:gliding motility-associated lipoprotein GldH
MQLTSSTSTGSMSVNQTQHNDTRMDCLPKCPLACRRVSLFLVISLILMVSCGKDAMYDNTKRIPRGVWSKKESLRFEVPVTDTVYPYKFYLNVRHSTDYRYSNVFFFINTVFPDGQKARDTVECILAQPDGKWLGKGISGTRDNQILLRVGLRFPMKGTYLFEFEQAMRVDTLKGISDVGLRLVRD